MPWPRLVDPAEVIQARWWFTPRGDWSSDNAPPRAVRAISVLLSSSEYWELHAYSTGLWSDTAAVVRDHGVVGAGQVDVTA